MRIEKINEKQIRCTLNQKDLRDREIGISELAYGTAKAKALFQDMMQQASYEFGFQADDIPLMIEAIPLLPEALVLIITKVEEPDELDTRFSNFTEEKDWYDEDEDEFLYDNMEVYDDKELAFYEEQGDTLSDTNSVWTYSEENAKSPYTENVEAENVTSSEDDFISLPEMLGMEPKPKFSHPEKNPDVVMIFSFRNLDDVTKLAYLIKDIYCGENAIYKDNTKGVFYLSLHRSNHSSEEFGKVCNILYEYGSIVKNSIYSEHYFEEHFTPIIAKDAIKILANI